MDRGWESLEPGALGALAPLYGNAAQGRAGHGGAVVSTVERMDRGERSLRARPDAVRCVAVFSSACSDSGKKCS